MVILFWNTDLIPFLLFLFHLFFSSIWFVSQKAGGEFATVYLQRNFSFHISLSQTVKQQTKKLTKTQTSNPFSSTQYSNNSLKNYPTKIFMLGYLFFFFFFFFGCHHSMQKFLSQGLNLNHSSDPSHSSGNTSSLICWAIRELQGYLFF